MRIYVRAPQPYAAEMKQGVKATFELPEYPNRKFEAKIDATSHAIDEVDLLVELIADNPKGELCPAPSPGSTSSCRRHESDDAPRRTRYWSAKNGAQVAIVGEMRRVALKKVQIPAISATNWKIPAASTLRRA